MLIRSVSLLEAEHHRYFFLSDLFDPKSLLMDRPRLIILINAAVIDKATQ